MSAESLTQTARSLGIVQADAAILQHAAAPFELPRQAAEAAHVLDRLTNTLDRFATVHNFRSGLGLSAPQLGIPRAAAAIRAPHGERHAVLNLRIIAQSADTDEEYEGCLSCFDVRGLIVGAGSSPRVWADIVDVVEHQPETPSLKRLQGSPELIPRTGGP